METGILHYEETHTPILTHTHTHTNTHSERKRDKGLRECEGSLTQTNVDVSRILMHINLNKIIPF